MSHHMKTNYTHMIDEDIYIYITPMNNWSERQQTQQLVTDSEPSTYKHKH